METRFSFGKNWGNFIDKYYDENRATAASQKLLKALGKDNLNNLTFLDIGSGSGIHSLAAWRAGAKQVVSFDYDQNSVNTTQKLWELAGKPNNWIIMQGSVLDIDFMNQLGSFDIVYSWGVLHHTGEMWAAIKNATIPLAENGTFFTALYSETHYRNLSYEGHKTPEQWLEIKQHYNATTDFGRMCMVYGYIVNNLYMRLKQNFPNIYHMARSSAGMFKDIHQYKKKRGMEYLTDIKDWLGGWPMEFVKEQDYINFMTELNFTPIRINAGGGNTEFIFCPQNTSNYWDEIIKKREFFAIPTIIQHERNNMYSVILPTTTRLEYTQKSKSNSSLMLYENGIPLGYNNSTLLGIERGTGQYLCLENKLYFSTSDASDPRTNNRQYTYCLDF